MVNVKPIKANYWSDWPVFKHFSCHITLHKSYRSNLTGEMAFDLPERQYALILWGNGQGRLTVQKDPRTTFVISGTMSKDMTSLIKKR
jgi:hypothetical protein